MKRVMVRRIVAALLLSLPFITAGESEVRAEDGAAATTARTSRGAWAVLEMHREQNDRLRPLRTLKPRAPSQQKMGLTTFSREQNSRRVNVLYYQTPLSIGASDVLLKVRAPGGRGSFMRIEFEF
ncbi:MAG: hypothetical protein JRG96_05965 [Deltaproteobacteria bacterium]|nr:hypothetical protein [Deltaproteobacteria bacterium]MBW2419244.1 hypothetical protein [Deltaproteobacteria bacterium]